MTRSLKTNTLWFLFCCNVLTTVAGSVPELRHWAWPLGSFSLLALLVLHLGWTLGPKRAAAYALFAAAVNGSAEVLGMRYGQLFGAHYVYREGPTAVLGLPLYVLAYWMIFQYTGYCLVTSYRYWLGVEKPARVKDLLWTVACDGLVVTLIDVFLDPISVRAGHWTWLEAGAFYGVPLGNFRGWFLVSCCVTGALRTLEYLRPRPEEQLDRSVYLIPVVGYASLGLSLYAQALPLGLAELARWCMPLIVGIALGNLALFARQRRARARPSPSPGL